jgi:hypothetical protein
LKKKGSRKTMAQESRSQGVSMDVYQTSISYEGQTSNAVRGSIFSPEVEVTLGITKPSREKNVSPAELEGKSITVKMTTPLHLMELRLNRLAYEDMRQSLLSDDHYRDKFVAFVKGMLVDSDLDKVALMNRVYEKYGYITIFVKKVERKEHVFEVPSPELRK